MLPLLKKQYPNASISVMVRPYTKELVEHHSCVDSVILWEEQKGTMDYIRLLRDRKFDIAIIYFYGDVISEDSG